MTEEDNKQPKTAQEIYQEVISHTRFLEGGLKGLIKHIANEVSETGEVKGSISVQGGRYMPGAGYKADAIYSFFGREILDTIRDDDSMSDKQALDEAVSSFEYLVSPLEVSKESESGYNEEKICISGPILDEDLGQEPENAVERNIYSEDVSFLESATEINFGYIRKRDIPQMRKALQERFPDNYGTGRENDLGRVPARRVISEFKKKLRYVKDRLNG